MYHPRNLTRTVLADLAHELATSARANDRPILPASELQHVGVGATHTSVYIQLDQLAASAVVTAAEALLDNPADLDNWSTEARDNLAQLVDDLITGTPKHDAAMALQDLFDDTGRARHLHAN